MNEVALLVVHSVGHVEEVEVRLDIVVVIDERDKLLDMICGGQFQDFAVNGLDVEESPFFSMGIWPVRNAAADSHVFSTDLEETLADFTKRCENNGCLCVVKNKNSRTPAIQTPSIPRLSRADLAPSGTETLPGSPCTL